MLKEIRVIDRGGFGVVHEVETKEGLRLAKKSFDPQIGTDDEREKLRKRFVREVRIQSQIRHPNIMPIVSYDLDASPPWFTMPLATGSFVQEIEKSRANKYIDPAPWQDILAAVEELHRLGYVHRDLKPANILCVDGKWVLSDFGLILPTARDTTVLTSSQSAYGSHYYAAPEQAQDFRNTPEQADIFALGCILHDAVDRVHPTFVRLILRIAH
jgi:serine/threonine protein kinase